MGLAGQTTGACACYTLSCEHTLPWACPHVNTYLGDTAEDLGVGRLVKASSSFQLSGRGSTRWVGLGVKGRGRLKETYKNRRQ